MRSDIMKNENITNDIMRSVIMTNVIMTNVADPSAEMLLLLYIEVHYKFLFEYDIWLNSSSY